MKKAVLCLAVILSTVNPVSAPPANPRGSAPPQSHTVVRKQASPLIIKAYISAYALEYKVEPAFAMAVAHIESRKGNQEFRSGCMGRTYYGPFGIHRCYLAKWPIDQLETNIQAGIRALRGSDLRRILKRYNAEFTESYWRAVMKARAKYRKEGVG